MIFCWHGLCVTDINFWQGSAVDGEQLLSGRIGEIGNSCWKRMGCWGPQLSMSSTGRARLTRNKNKHFPTISCRRDRLNLKIKYFQKISCSEEDLAELAPVSSDWRAHIPSAQRWMYEYNTYLTTVASLCLTSHCNVIIACSLMFFISYFSIHQSQYL
jgi:hypothetical protein